MAMKNVCKHNVQRISFINCYFATLHLCTFFFVLISRYWMVQNPDQNSHFVSVSLYLFLFFLAIVFATRDLLSAALHIYHVYVYWLSSCHFLFASSRFSYNLCLWQLLQKIILTTVMFTIICDPSAHN